MLAHLIAPIADLSMAANVSVAADICGANAIVLAKAAITWTPKTFYIAASIFHIIVILIAFKVLQIDPEHNTFVSAVVGAAVCNLIAFAVSGYGLFGILVTGVAFFVMLVAISSGEVLKASMALLIVMAAYGGLGMLVTQRTPLTAESIGGLPQVIISGGIEAEPITEKDANKLGQPASKSK